MRPIIAAMSASIFFAMAPPASAWVAAPVSKDALRQLYGFENVKKFKGECKYKYKADKKGFKEEYKCK